MATNTTKATQKKNMVFVESPYSGDIDRNMRYLQLAKLDAKARNEFPVASHDNMTMHPRCATFFVPDNDNKWETWTREEAIETAQQLRHMCAMTVFYADIKWSSGMKAGLEYCRKYSLPYEVRTLNVQRISEIAPHMLTKEFINAIRRNKPYKHFLETCKNKPDVDPELMIEEACNLITDLHGDTHHDIGVKINLPLKKALQEDILKKPHDEQMRYLYCETYLKLFDDRDRENKSAKAIYTACRVWLEACGGAPVKMDNNFDVIHLGRGFFDDHPPHGVVTALNKMKMFDLCKEYVELHNKPESSIQYQYKKPINGPIKRKSNEIESSEREEEFSTNKPVQ